MRRGKRSVASWGLGAALATLLCACAARTAAPAPSAPPAQTPTPRPAPPAARVPDQPYVGTPGPANPSFLEILRLREAGESNEALLAKVRRENVAYSLSTFDIQKLRAAGVSEEVITAMLASGRESRTATPASASAPTPTPRAS